MSWYSTKLKLEIDISNYALKVNGVEVIEDYDEHVKCCKAFDRPHYDQVFHSPEGLAEHLRALILDRARQRKERS